MQGNFYLLLFCFPAFNTLSGLIHFDELAPLVGDILPKLHILDHFNIISIC